MILLLIGFCVGLLPGLFIALITIYNVQEGSELLKERLAAEEASKRHFLDLSTRLEITVEKMYQEQKRLEVENSIHRSRALDAEAV